MKELLQAGIVGLAASALAACGGGGGGSGGSAAQPPAPPATYTVGGSVTGLRGTGLVLENNGGDPVTIAANGTFTFATQHQSASAYTVTVRAQPPAEVCTVTRGTGSIGSASITDVAVACRAMTGRFLYIAHSPSRVSGFSIDAVTGTLTEIPGSPFFSQGHEPRAVFMDPAGRHLFVTGSVTPSEGPGSLTAYAIDQATGSLTLITGTPLPLNTNVNAIFFHPNGRFIYNAAFVFSAGMSVASPDNGLYGYTFDPATGALAPVPGNPFRFPPDTGPRAGAFSPDGTTLFVPSGSINPGGAPRRVSALAVDGTTGAVALRGTTDFSTSVNEIVMHPGGAFAYARLADGSVAMVGVDNPAALPTPVNVATPGFGVGSLFDRTGNYAYFVFNGLTPAAPVPVFGPGSIFGYRVDRATGLLQPLPGSPYATGGVLAGAATFDPTGRIMVATNFQSASVAALTVDGATGALAHVAGSPFSPAAGTTPMAITFDPSGRFAYLPDTTGFAVSAYAMDISTGQLTFISSYALGGTPVGVARIAGLQ